MAHVVCEPCHNCKYTDCVTVCPTDSFYEGETMLFIDPDSCIDCGACQPECPAEAIYLDSQVPAPWIKYISLNAERVAALASGSPITEKKDPMLGAGCRGAV